PWRKCQQGGREGRGARRVAAQDMRFRLISCEVFARPAYRAAAKSPHIVDMAFTRLRSHVNPHQLRREIQEAIDSTAEGYDAILLGYGLCGNSTGRTRAGWHHSLPRYCLWPPVSHASADAGLRGTSAL